MNVPAMCLPRGTAGIIPVHLCQSIDAHTPRAVMPSVGLCYCPHRDPLRDREVAAMPMTPVPPANTSSPFSDVRGHHVALRVPQFEASKRWFIDKLDFRLVFEWPSGDRTVAYLAPANDDGFWIEILGDGSPAPQERPRMNLGESLNQAG